MSSKANKASKTSGKTKASIKSTAPSKLEHELTEQELLGHLPKCITLEKGWWSYKWCHRKEIHQFHKEPDGTVSTKWSLGKFDAAKKSTSKKTKY